MYYLNTLKAKNVDEKALDEFKANYDRLVLTNDMKKDLLSSLMLLAGAVSEAGILWWKTFTVSLLNIQALKLLLDLLLVDSVLLTLFQHAPSAKLKVLNLHYHLTEDASRASALNFIEFVVLQKVFEDYTAYVEPAGQEVITHHFCTLKKPVDFTMVTSPAASDSARDLLGSASKRKLAPSDNPGKDEPPQKKVKQISKDEISNEKSNSHQTGSGHGRWFWACDTDEGQQEAWTPYDQETSDAIEKAFQLKQKTKKIDALRFVDFTTMTQKRFDNLSKKRGLKRVVDSEDSKY